MKEKFRKIWAYLKPPLTWKEAKKKGPRYLVLIILFYLVRDLILYVILPWTVWRAVF